MQGGKTSQGKLGCSLAEAGRAVQKRPECFILYLHSSLRYRVLGSG